jgi:UDP-N-acetylglucosamine transferase subunit ALG13
MIFVTLGTSEFQFDRLVRELDHLPHDEEVVVQCRRSAIKPERAIWFDDLPFESIVDYVRRARHVVCHAGVGSILTVAANGKRAIVVPRMSRFGEAVDDHQLPFARRLRDADLITLIEDPEDLPAALASASSEGVRPREGSRLAVDLRKYLTSVVHHAASGT